MFERYTDEAKRVIYFALIEAQHRNEENISVKDILIALTRESASPSIEATRLRGLAVALRAAVGIPHLPITSRPYKYTSAIPLDDDSKMAIRQAEIAANEDRQYWVDSDHLLRGLLAFPTQARDALVSFGLDLDSVRRSSKVYRREFPSARAPKWARLKVFLSRLKLNQHPDLVRLLAALSLIVLLSLILILVLKVRGPL